MTSKPFDLFFRNPFSYYRQLVQCGEVDVSWDRGLLQKKKIDQQKFSQLAFGRTGKFWRSYSISSWDCIEYNSDSKKNRPSAVYPTFDWQNDQLRHLLEYIVSPWGEDPSIYANKDLDLSERPVAGQPHKIFVTNMPDCKTMVGKSALVELARIQRTCPEVEIFVHRLFGYGNLFNNFIAGDLEPRVRASKGMIQLANGKYFDPREKSERTVANLIRTTPWEVSDLADAGNRCMFNIQSARQASINWNREGRMPFSSPVNFTRDTDSSDIDVVPPIVKKKPPLISLGSSLAIE